MARDVIRDHHPHLLANAVKVLYLFTDKAEKVKGKVVLGTARKVSGLNAYLARMGENDWDDIPDFFLICVWSGWWDSRHTTDDQRRALVDHELCHCFSEEEEDKTGNPTGKVTLSVLPHDLTEFNAVAARHGEWQPDITAFLAALCGDLEGEEHQPRLFSLDGGHDKEGGPPGVTMTFQDKSVTLSPDELRATRDRLHRQAGRGS